MDPSRNQPNSPYPRRNLWDSSDHESILNFHPKVQFIYCLYKDLDRMRGATDPLE